MNTRLEKAISEYRKAQEENRVAQINYKAAQDNTRLIIDNITSGNVGAARFEALKDNKDIINKAVNAENDAKKAANFAQAVLMACGENVADIAANVFIDAVRDNEKDFSMPLHYKKFKSNFEKVLDPEYFYFENSYGCSFYVVFRLAQYGHNSSWAFSIQNGVLLLEDERNKKKAENTLADIKKEAKKAFADAEKLRKAIDDLKKADARKDYKTHIRYYLPYVESSAVHDDYRLF